MRRELVIASGNVHKTREIRDILKDLKGFEVLTLKSFPQYQISLEQGSTFIENARRKALHASQALGHLALADESGLVVPALNGEPGLMSARYGETDRDKRMKLLMRMRALSEEQRYAYYICVVAVATPEGNVMVEEAQCEGQVVTSERGSNGYSYDPLFIKHHYSRTFGELDEATKNRISHRRKALDKIRNQLESLGE